MQAVVYQTGKYSEDRLASKGRIAFETISRAEESRGYRKATLFLDPKAEFQTLEGLGGALTEAACWTMMQMPQAMRSEVLKSYFAPCPGGGYSMVRVAMNSCDFSLENYSCCDTAGDYELKTFSIERDRQWVIPVLKEAFALQPDLKVLISPWSPPAWMKSNQDMNHGGKLLAECFASWALFYCRYIEELGKEGIPVWGLTINNEPNASQGWDSMIVSGEEERDFVRDHLGPMLEKRGLADVKVLIWDHNRNYLFNRASVVYRDPEAARYIWGAAFHWYDDNCYDNVMLTHDAFPDKKLLFSEGCNGGNNYSDPEWGNADVRDPNGLYIHRGVWEAGERYAHNMLMDFNRHTCAWLDWNMVLNENGGPRHLPNGCAAPYIFDTRNGKLEVLESYFYLAHFFHFLTAGARRIVAAPSMNVLETTAFRNPDGKIILIVLNRSEKELAFDCVLSGRKAVATLSPRSIQTWVIEA